MGLLCDADSCDQGKGPEAEDPRLDSWINFVCRNNHIYFLRLLEVCMVSC